MELFYVTIRQLFTTPHDGHDRYRTIYSVRGTREECERWVDDFFWQNKLAVRSECKVTYHKMRDMPLDRCIGMHSMI